MTFGLTAPQGVAAGLVGRSIAFQGGAATWVLGFLLHFFIAFVVAAVYCLIARKLTFLADSWIICGIFYGIVVFMFMNLVVVPLSALHLTGPFSRSTLLQGIIGNMFEIGLPISFSMHTLGHVQLDANPSKDNYGRRARTGEHALLRSMLSGGMIAGSLDKISGFITAGLRSPQGIAAGLIGRSAAFRGGAPTWILGLALHFFIAVTVASIYCLAAKRLRFLSKHWLLCGPIYGIAVFLMMNLVVLPVSALHLAGPYTLRGLLQGTLVHMALVGLPISFCLHKFDGEAS